MGCLVRLVGGAAVLVLGLGLVFMVMKWIAPGVDFGWGMIIGMIVGGLVVGGACFVVIENE